MDFKMDHPLLGPMMHRNREGGWRGQLRLPAFGDWRVLYNQSFELEQEVELDDELQAELDALKLEKPDPPEPPPDVFTVHVDDPRREGITAAQEAALRFLVHEQDVYAKAIQGELSRVVRLILQDELQLYRRDPQFGLPLNRAAKAAGLDQPEGVTKLVELGSIHVLRQAKAGQSYLAFEFGCAWDEEHGASVLVHAGNALASGAAAEFFLDTYPAENFVEDQRNGLVRGFDPYFEAEERRKQREGGDVTPTAEVLTRDHPLLGKITYDRDNSAWVGKVSLPAMASWCVVYHRVNNEFVEFDPEQPPSDQFDVQMQDPQAVGPSAAQDVALYEIMQNHEQYAQALLGEISRRMALSLDRESQLRPKFWVSRLIDRAKELRLDTAGGAAKLVSLQAIDVLQQEDKGRSYSMWRFEWGWDVDHGLTVVMHRGHALASGAHADFSENEDDGILIQRLRGGDASGNAGS